MDLLSRRGSKREKGPARAKPYRARTQWQMVRRELAKNKAAMIGLAVILAIVAAAVLAPVIAPYDPTAIDPPAQFKPPALKGELLGWAADGRDVYAKPHFMGCDELGRDVFSRVLYGGRVSLQVAIVCNLIGMAFGIVLGTISGFFGGVTDLLIQRFVDILYAFPGILLALAVIAVIGPSMMNVMLAIGIAWIPVYTRLSRSSVLSAREEVYVMAARCIGVPTGRMIVKHILPNIVAPLIVLGSVAMGSAILTAAALSYIGLGVQKPTPEWGVILSEGRRYMNQAPWIMLFPGLAISITVLAVNMLGDGLRTALDPRLRRE